MSSSTFASLAEQLNVNISRRERRRQPGTPGQSRSSQARQTSHARRQTREPFNNIFLFYTNNSTRSFITHVPSYTNHKHTHTTASTTRSLIRLRSPMERNTRATQGRATDAYAQTKENVYAGAIPPNLRAQEHRCSTAQA